MEDKDLTPELIIRDLPTRFIGQKVIYFPSVESTMDAARREARWGAEAGTVILAGQQTAGRGRLKRAWLSPLGSLAFSVILRPNLDYLPYLVMLTSLAVTYGIQAVTGLNPQIKWPNDVLISSKKVCGILIENDIRKNNLNYSVIGIGLNVNLHVAEVAEIAPIATSLSDELKAEVSRLEVLRQVLVEMDKLYLFLPQTETILELWKAHLVTIGRRVHVNLGNRVCRGTAEAVNRDGSLMIRQKDGSLVRIEVGDVNFS